MSKRCCRACKKVPDVSEIHVKFFSEQLFDQIWSNLFYWKFSLNLSEIKPNFFPKALTALCSRLLIRCWDRDIFIEGNCSIDRRRSSLGGFRCNLVIVGWQMWNLIGKKLHQSFAINARTRVSTFDVPRTTTFTTTNVYARYKVCTYSHACVYTRATIVAIFCEENYVLRG